MERYRLSVVVEWETVQLWGGQPLMGSRHSERGERERAGEMLSRLGEQVRRTDGTFAKPVELFICLDDTEVDLDDCRTFVLDSLGDDRDLFTVQFVAVAGAEYFELKNAGARQASGDFVVFVDSDVLPEPAWLENVVRPMIEDESIAVVQGSTYIELRGLLSKTFALIWHFPLRPNSTDVRPIPLFPFANNVAFRGEVAQRFPFPPVGDRSRGSELMVSAELASSRMKIVLAHGARAGHLPPIGSFFVVRALAEGRDRVLTFPQSPPPRGTAGRLFGDLSHSIRSLVRGWRDVGMARLELPFAAGISTAFALCCSLGELGTVINRDFMVRHFRT